jgi:hypothetical protein
MNHRTEQFKPIYIAKLARFTCQVSPMFVKEEFFVRFIPESHHIVYAYIRTGVSIILSLAQIFQCLIALCHTTEESTDWLYLRYQRLCIEETEEICAQVGRKCGPIYQTRIAFVESLSFYRARVFIVFLWCMSNGTLHPVVSD